MNKICDFVSFLHPVGVRADWEVCFGSMEKGGRVAELLLTLVTFPLFPSFLWGLDVVYSKTGFYCLSTQFQI